MRTTTNTLRMRTVSRVLQSGLALMGIACGAAGAQQSQGVPVVGRARLQVSIDVKKTSLLAVVESLMKQAHGDYTFDSQLLDAPIGAIHLTKVPLRAALDIALSASGKPATYRLENGVYMVTAKVVESVPQPGLGITWRETSDTREPKISVSTDASSGESRIRLSAVNANLYDALKLLFGAARAQYILDPSLRDVIVTVNIDQPLRTALETLLLAGSHRQPLTYRLENDVYSIVPKQ